MKGECSHNYANPALVRAIENCGIATLRNGDISESSIGLFFENSSCEGIYTEFVA